MKAACCIALVTVASLAAAQAPHPSSAAGGNALVGAWRLVRIDVAGPDDKPTSTPQPTGMLIYTADGHVSVQLMYPKSANAADNEYVSGGYEASFGAYDLDQAKHILTHHVQGSITRDLLVGKDLPRAYRLTANGHLIIRSADPREHWSVTWEHY